MDRTADIPRTFVARRNRVAWTGLVWALSLACWVGAARAQTVAVIAHPSVPVDTISQTQLLNFYTGDVQAWDDRKQVVVFDLKPRGTIRDAFYEYLGKTSSRMRSIWLKRKLAGEGDPPESFETEEEMLTHVADTEGAVGFVLASKVDATVKTLATIPMDSQ